MGYPILQQKILIQVETQLVSETPYINVYQIILIIPSLRNKKIKWQKVNKIQTIYFYNIDHILILRIKKPENIQDIIVRTCLVNKIMLAVIKKTSKIHLLKISLAIRNCQRCLCIQRFL